MRFPTDGGKERIFGLRAGYQSSLYQLATSIGSSLGLSFIQPEQMQVTINTDAWKQVFESAKQAVDAGVLYQQDPNGFAGGRSYEEFLMSDPFIGGKTAMSIEGVHLMRQIEEAQTYLEDKGVQNWDLVTVPVDPNNPDYSPSMSVSNIFAINAESPNIEGALAFMRYVHSDEYARVTSKTNTGQFPVRTQYVQDDGEHNLAAFYSLKPAVNEMYRDLSDVPQEFFMQFRGIAEQEMQLVTDGQKTVGEALDTLQTRGQELLIQAQQNEEQAYVPSL